MPDKIQSPDDYLKQLSDERRTVMEKLRKTFKENLPEGFTETISYGMISYVVPHSLYPAGYHCDKTQPLPFISIASQKNFVSIYHMGLYADKKLMEWFTAEYPKYVKTKLDMGKSCIRFKKPELIPFKLIGDLATKMTVNQWITTFETVFKK